MEKYTDLKFEGDLAFLNEHIEQALINANNASSVSENEENTTEPERTFKTSSYFENNGNFAYNLTSQTNRNVASQANFANKILDNQNNFENLQPRNNIKQDAPVGSQNSIKSNAYNKNEVNLNTNNHQLSSELSALAEKVNLGDSQNTIDSRNAISSVEKSVVEFKNLEFTDRNTIANHTENSGLANIQDTNNDSIDADLLETVIDEVYAIESPYNPINTELSEYEVVDDTFEVVHKANNSDKSQNNIDPKYYEAFEQLDDVYTTNNQATTVNRITSVPQETTVDGGDVDKTIEFRTSFEQSTTIDDDNKFHSTIVSDYGGSINNSVNEHFSKFEHLEKNNFKNSSETIENPIAAILREISSEGVDSRKSIGSDLDVIQNTVPENGNGIPFSSNLDKTNELYTLNNNHLVTEQFEHAKVIEIGAENLDDNDNNWPEVNRYEFGSSKMTNSSHYSEKKESFHNDNSNTNGMAFMQNTNLINNDGNVHHTTQFDQLEKMENTKSTQNNNSFKDLRNAQDFNGNRFNNVGNNLESGNLVKPEMIKEDGNYNHKYYSNTDEIRDSRDEYVRPQYEQSEKRRDIKDARYSEMYHNKNDFDSNDRGVSTGSHITSNRANFTESERVKNSNDVNFQIPRNYKNSDEVRNSRDPQYDSEADKTRNLRDNQNFQNTRNFQDLNSRRYNGLENKWDQDDFVRPKGTGDDDNFQRTNYNRNNSVFNNGYDLPQGTPLTQPEKTANFKESVNQERFQDTRNFEEGRSNKFNGLESNHVNDSFYASEKFKTENNFQSDSYDKNAEEFNNGRNVQHGLQFDHSENFRNPRNNQKRDNFENARHFEDTMSSKYNGAESYHNRDHFEQSETLKNNTDPHFQNLRNYRIPEQYSNGNDPQFRAKFEQSERTTDFRDVQKNENFQGGGSNFHINDYHKTQYGNNIADGDQFYNLKRGNEKQSLPNLEHINTSSSNQYIQNEPISHINGNINYDNNNYRNSKSETGHGAQEQSSTKKIFDVNTYTVNEFEVVKPSSNKRKSQLELMLLSSGFDMELFNNFKEELLELEKDNIIMKYKQDLMMMILKG